MHKHSAALQFQGQSQRRQLQLLCACHTVNFLVGLPRNCETEGTRYPEQEETHTPRDRPLPIQQRLDGTKEMCWRIPLRVAAGKQQRESAWPCQA